MLKTIFFLLLIFILFSFYFVKRKKKLPMVIKENKDKRKEYK